MFIAVFPLKRIRRGKLLLGNILITMSIIFAKQISFCVAVPAIQAKERKLYRVGSNPHIVSRNKSIEQRWRKSSNDISKENANDINESRLIPKRRHEKFELGAFHLPSRRGLAVNENRIRRQDEGKDKVCGRFHR